MDASTVTIYSDAFPTDDTSPTACQLVVVEGPDTGRAVRLGADPVVVGTDPESAIVLSDDRVSRRHMRITRDGHRFLVEDLESLNGTTYEGIEVQRATVGLGSMLKLGRTALRIQPIARALDLPPSQSRRFGELVAESLSMREVFAVLELAAASDVTVLIEGATGTGKELCARALHDASPRAKGPFVAVDCGALPATLVDSALFGHVSGAFTGAQGARDGAFVRAHGGTIFLDELGAVSLDVQAKLLRVLEERRVRPLGGDIERPVDLRVIAASGRALVGAAAEGSFRADLFYRLSVVHIALPELQQRREDIAPMARAILERRGFDPGPILGANLDRLTAHDWPGNVRELRNVLERALALTPGAECFEDLRVDVRSLGATADARAVSVRSDLAFSEAKALVLEDFERRYLADVLARCAGNISQAAREAAIDRKHLRHLLRRHGLIDAPES